MTSFVGRREATTELKRTLADSRLVTLTGVGGVGKSRLALHVARGLRRIFRDGVSLVELAKVEDPSQVHQAVAVALGLRDQSARDLTTVLVDYLADKHMLLVFDNCEHLLDVCGTLMDTLLSAAPGLRMLATSREPLTIRAEHVWPVSPLAVPADPAPAEDLPREHRRYEALALFEDRAAAVLPGFELGPETLPEAAQLCRRLDGVPLAIELAAVRARSLSVAQILSRLEDRFQLLNVGSRVGLPRHRTLRATVDWSFDLCTEEERTVWARCSVFAGDFDLDAAEYVCADDGLGVHGVFRGVAGLVDKSLLVPEQGRRSARYRMLETIRQYGHEKLVAADEIDSVRRRHRDYYLRLAQRSDQDSGGPKQADWGERLRAERPDLVAALDYCCTTPGEARTGLRMCSALWFFWIACGYIRDGRYWLDRMLALDTEPSPVRARALWTNGWVAILQGDTAGGLALLEECRVIAGRIGDETALSHGIQLTGAARLWDNDPARGAELLDHALVRHRAAGAWTAPALITLGMRGMSAAFLDRHDEAIAFCEDCCTMCGRFGEQWARSWSMWMLGVTSWVLGTPVEAIRRLRESLRFKQVLSDQLGIAFCIEAFGWLAASGGDARRAAVLFGVTARMWEMIGRPLFGYRSLLDWSDEANRRITAELDEQSYQDARRFGAELTTEAAIAYALGDDLPRAAKRRRAGPDDALTKRELEVVELVTAGMTNREIAANLVIATRTAEAHIEHILSKLGFTSRTQIAAWSVERKR
jgi:predicted ATPase/DNA-binding CsgD family transcriptional regulator